MERYALTFPVRPGTEARVRHVLRSYPPPDTAVDGGGRLLATSVFLWRNHVVRVIDVDGPLAAVQRHLAADPAVRATEERLNPLLSSPRNLGDPEEMRDFFARSRMTRVVHREPEDPGPGPGPRPSTRVAVRYPVRPGCGEALARELARVGARSSGTGSAPVRTTVFRHDDLVVEVSDVPVGGRDAVVPADPVLLGADEGMLATLLEPGWDLSTSSGVERLRAAQTLSAVTHRDTGAVTS
ncbi:SchA/CurD-like domain-containing protein [Saccharomonospora halophila]|uniref:SchA/CurD-like domain-containing protein n=1 Tax=Saccharomonospora halophila TaxID=129922 RepID=UPI00037B1F33|nr:SchA/CurD-like domain-containing protein [Saccharomonospora halophila]